MEPRSLTYLCAAARGRLAGGGEDVLFSGICTDSRAIKAGDLFVPLSGERFDGHDFLDEVIKKGAGAILIDEKRSRSFPVPSILVPDTRKALGAIATRYRHDLRIPVVAVGGSNGKTTTKDFLATLLREKFDTAASPASFNNDIGVPVTLLNIEARHRAAVLEVGTNHPGELRPLLEMMQPTHGIITSLGREHLEFFGDMEGVVEEEGWVAEVLPASGALILNGDSPWSGRLVERTKARPIRVGFQSGNDWVISQTRIDANGTSFRVSAPSTQFCGEFAVNAVGKHQALNVTLAMSAAAELGLSPEEIRRGISKCSPSRMRLQMKDFAGIQILDDSYNANADSMAAALQTLHDLPVGGRRIAVLGDMAELGKHSEDAHAEVGRRAAELGISHLIAVGHWAEHVISAARAAGLPQVDVCGGPEEASLLLRRIARKGDVVLIKASRSTGLDRILKSLESASTPHAN